MRAAALGLMMAFALAGTARAAPSPVVLELFTSQGCSSCPPADALLGRLKADDADVLPLSLHVDYWNRIGWRDPYSSAAITTRQQNYAEWLGQDGVYTPELVVDGVRGVVGSDRAAVEQAIRQARAAHALLPPVALRVSGDGAGVLIAVGAGPGRGQVLVVGYDGQHVTAIPRGENAGRTLTDTNVVRALAKVADWVGQPLTARAARPAGEHVAVLLQAPGGRILAARILPE